MRLAMLTVPTACHSTYPTPGSVAAEHPETPSAAAERSSKAKGKGKQVLPEQQAEAGTPAAAAAAAGHPSGVDALLQQAGFIKRIDSMSYGIAQSKPRVGWAWDALC